MDDRENAMAEQTPTTDSIAHIKLQQFIKRLRNKFAQTVVVRKVNKRIKKQDQKSKPRNPCSSWEDREVNPE